MVEMILCSRRRGRRSEIDRGSSLLRRDSEDSVRCEKKEKEDSLVAKEGGSCCSLRPRRERERVETIGSLDVDILE
jgi:hypothetical protein